MSVPLASFDSVMAYMDMVESGISPEDEVEEKRKILIHALEEIGADLTSILLQRREEIDATGRSIIQKLADEKHFSAAQSHLTVLEKTCQNTEVGIKMLQSANGNAQNYLRQLQQQNAQLISQLAAAKQKLKERPPLGRNQGEIFRGIDALTRHISK